MLDRRPDIDGMWVTRIPVELPPEAFIAANRPAAVPQLICKGLCWESCSNMPVTPMEQRRVERASGRELFLTSEGRCSMLNAERRCDAYQARPLVCKIYGTSEGMMCPYGCETMSGQYLTHAEGLALLAEAALFEGDHSLPEVRS
jgi:Fe-S-cluster containining protein